MAWESRPQKYIKYHKILQHIESNIIFNKCILKQNMPHISKNIRMWTISYKTIIYLFSVHCTVYDIIYKIVIVKEYCSI